MTETERALKIRRDLLSVIDGLLGDCADAHRRHSAEPEPPISVAVSALRASVNYRNHREREAGNSLPSHAND